MANRIKESRDAKRARDTMRTLMAAGWHAESMLVDAGAEVIGGDEAAKMTAQRVYDETFKITVPN